MIPYGHQSLSSEDIEEVIKVLKSAFLTQGNAVPMFEKNLCNYTGAKFAVAVNSGTSALHLACRAIDLKENDWLWTTPLSFAASANAALYCNASVDFVDIDPVTNNIDVNKLSEKLRLAGQTNTLPKVLVPVHLAGLSCEMDEIKKLSKQYGFFIVEDACHALGGRYKDIKIGSCQYSDMAVFSFHPVKSITTGEGGMVMTNSPSLTEKMRLLRTHGITRDPKLMTKQEPDGPWYYEQIDLGYNYRMNDFQAALGSSQLKRLDAFIGKRNKIAKLYNSLFGELPLQLPATVETCYSAFHLYIIRLHLNLISCSHSQVFSSLLQQGIGVNLHYIPIHLQPYYREMGFKEGDFPESEKYYREAITLPIFVDLSSEEIQKVVDSVKRAIQ